MLHRYLPVITSLLFATTLEAQTFEQQINPLIVRYCHDCHTGDDPSGSVDFAAIQTKEAVSQSFETWAKVDELLSLRQMPPEDAAQPTQEEIATIRNWYQQLLNSVEPKPGTHRPRRLSATEYRNTLRSLFGFDLEVNVMEAEQTITEKSLVLKLLPTDPPGKSGYRNDTHSNPLSTQIWEQYSYLADTAITELFSEHRRTQLLELIGSDITSEGFDSKLAEALIRNFAPRIHRRPLDELKLSQILDRLQNTDDPRAAARVELKRLLMAPSFLYRGLRMPTIPGEQQPVDDYELAERLSYFLWGEMPDGTLFELAAANELHKADVLDKQVTRMLDSPKATHLATDFAVQWLSLDEIEHVSDNPPYMVALKSQPIDFFDYLIRQTRPLLEFVDSNVTFINPLTRRYYVPDTKQLGKYRKPSGIEIEIVANQQIQLRNTKGRGGMLTMPGVLAMNRGPILRGVWLLERILGEHLPDPPADVGQVQANIPGENLTFRERFAQHREDESCALCHDKIDPLGFALEAYDDGGGFVLADNYKRPRKKKKQDNQSHDKAVDTSGQLPSGESFEDFEQLKQILVSSQRERITRNLVRQLLAYALCRKLEIYDQPTVESIVMAVKSEEATWRDLISEIVHSLPFRQTYVPANHENGPPLETAH